MSTRRCHRPASRPAPSSWLNESRRRVRQFWVLKTVGISAFIALFFAAYFFVLRHPSRPPLVLPTTWLDRHMVFVPAAIPFYASLWVYATFPPVLLERFRELLRYGFWLGLMCAACLFVFWIFPTEVPTPVISSSAPASLRWLKSVDASGNAFPSLHVATAVFSAIWLRQQLRELRAPRLLAWCNWLLCVAIAWSTLATLQHVTLDVGAGGVVGWTFARLALHDFALIGLRAPMQSDEPATAPEPADMNT